jgi:hypothetical protein
LTRLTAALRPGPAIPRVAATAGIYVASALSSVVLALLVVAGSNLGIVLRLVIALGIAFLLVTLCLARPALGVAATLMYLVVMAFLRRILIPAASWTSFDPMLLVSSLVAVVLIVKLYVLERRRLAPDLLSKLMLALMALTVIQVANPTGPGVKSNLLGLLFMLAPLFWFFVGREVLSDVVSDRILGMVLLSSIVIAAYGLYQTEVAEPVWDVNWLNLAGYTSLNVGGTVRAFGTFSSAAEYNLFISSGLAIAFAYALRGRLIAFLAVPALAVAVFFGSGRSALILGFLAIVIMFALHTHRPKVAVLIVVCAVGGAFGVLTVFGSSLSHGASGSSSLVSHEVNGITNPLDPSSSTLIIHVQEVITGFKQGVTHPEGEGPGTTNNAAGFSQASNVQSSSANPVGQATEVDISNAFVSLGFPGGVLYLAIVLLTMGKAVVDYFSGREAVLPVIGVLVVAAGQWLIGGNYALSALIWLLVGWIAAGWAGGGRARPQPATSVH